MAEMAETAELREENAELRGENAELRAQVAALQAQLSTLDLKPEPEVEPEAEPTLRGAKWTEAALAILHGDVAYMKAMHHQVHGDRAIVHPNWQKIADKLNEAGFKPFPNNVSRKFTAQMCESKYYREENHYYDYDNWTEAALAMLKADVANGESFPKCAENLNAAGFKPFPKNGSRKYTTNLCKCEAIRQGWYTTGSRHIPTGGSKEKPFKEEWRKFLEEHIIHPDGTPKSKRERNVAAAYRASCATKCLTEGNLILRIISATLRSKCQNTDRKRTKF